MQRLRPGPVTVALPFLRKNVPTPVTQSFEDDMVRIAELHGSVWRSGGPEFERSRRLHGFALYRLYRAMKRVVWTPKFEPAVFGELKREQAIRLTDAASI
jgi:hypothetical protein